MKNSNKNKTEIYVNRHMKNKRRKESKTIFKKGGMEEQKLKINFIYTYKNKGQQPMQYFF